METTYSSTLKIHKLSKAQYDGITTKDATALYLTPEQPVTFTSSGGASAGATYDGSAAVTVSYATVGAASSGHTHTSKITLSSATSAGTASSISLNHGSSYKLWTGSASAFTFTMPSTPTHTCSIASESTAASSLTLAHGSRYKLTAGGNSFVFTMPSSGNTDTKVTQTSLSTSGTTDYYLLASNTSSPTSGTAYGAYYTSYVKLRGTGQLTAQTFYAASDKRLKENIVAYTPPKSVLDLPIYTYNYISDESKTQHIGCLAQDLQEICPELVSLDGEYLTINESKIVYLLLDEVKKLKAEVEGLKTKI
jgi:hypothetical protein